MIIDSFKRDIILLIPMSAVKNYEFNRILPLDAHKGIYSRTPSVSEGSFYKSLKLLGYDTYLLYFPLQIAKKAHNGSFMKRSKRYYLEEHIFPSALNLIHHYSCSFEDLPDFKDVLTMLLHDSIEDFGDRDCVRDREIGFYNSKEEVENAIMILEELDGSLKGIFSQVDSLTNYLDKPMSYGEKLRFLSECDSDDIKNNLRYKLVDMKFIDRLTTMRSQVNMHPSVLVDMHSRANEFLPFSGYVSMPTLLDDFNYEMENLLKLFN